ncbi:MAG TPA: hypothetical protein VEK35_11730, partial [Roseiarcus sp.]|nr:hypothetical protein [Roseiarcus sp.]
MKSAIVGLARQGVVVAGVSALLIGAIYSGTSNQRRAEAARQSAMIAPPLQVQSVVSASPALPALPSAEAPAAAPQAKTPAKASCASPPCARTTPAKAQLAAAARPAPDRAAQPIDIASAVEAPRDS